MRYIVAVMLCCMLNFSQGNAQSFKKIDSDVLQAITHNYNDTTYVVNFWATWCKPCVKELPEFEEVNQHFKSKKFKMILVSLDFDTQLDSKVKPFVKDQNIQSKVVLLADTKQNDWIDKVNPEWSGSIPVTVIYNNDFYFFKEGSMSYDELNEIITKNIKQ